MIYIYQDKTNKVITRFFDKRLQLDSYFLWKVTNEFSKKEVLFITEDLSDNKCAFSLFDLKHSSSLCYDNDIGLCIEPGHNEYVVYETTNYSLDEQFIIQEIDRDIMFVEIIRDVNTTNSNMNDVYY